MRLTHWAKVDTRWYLGVRCGKCGRPILFALDYSDQLNQPPAPLKLLLTCPLRECGHQAEYSQVVVSRFQKESNAK